MSHGVTPENNQIISGNIEIAFEGNKMDLLDRLEELFRIDFELERSDLSEDKEYYWAEALGFRFSLEVSSESESSKYRLYYRSANNCIVAPSSVLNLDFHFNRLLSNL